MANEFAVDVLYGTGWLPLDTAGCMKDGSGRWYPSRERAERECRDLGAQVTLNEPAGYACVTADWKTDTDEGRAIAPEAGEAMMHALAQIRRSRMSTPAGA